MDPQIYLLTVTQIDWQALRTTIAKVFEDRPDSTLGQYPVKFHEDAEYLLYIAWLNNIDISNPTRVLRYLSPILLEHLHYSFMIACEASLAAEFRINSTLTMTIKDTGLTNFILVAGALNKWFDMVTLNLTKRTLSPSMRLLLDQFLLIFEKRGLQHLFSNYHKVTQKDNTFLLEHKK